MSRLGHIPRRRRTMPAFGILYSRSDGAARIMPPSTRALLRYGRDYFAYGYFKMALAAHHFFIISRRREAQSGGDSALQCNADITAYFTSLFAPRRMPSPQPRTSLFPADIPAALKS